MAEYWQKDSWIRVAGLVAGLVVCGEALQQTFSLREWGEIVLYGTLAFLLRLRPVPLLKDAQGNTLLSHVPGESLLVVMLLRQGVPAAILVSLLTNILAFGRIWRDWVLIRSRLLSSLSTIFWLPFLVYVCRNCYELLGGIRLKTSADCLLLFHSPRAVVIPLAVGILVAYEFLNRLYSSLGLWLKRDVPLKDTLLDWDVGVYEHLENAGALLGLAMWTTWGWGALPYIVFLMEAVALAARERVQNREARKEARSDPLTGLASMRGLSLEIQSLLRAQGKHFALLYLDMDGFKQVNDRFGHAVGDVLLVRVSEALRGALRSEDVVGRRGGDEFVVVLPRRERAEAEQVLMRLRRSVESTLASDPRFIGVSFSAGVAVYPGDGRTEGTLLDAADQAMYAEKQQRRRRVA